MPVRVLLAEDNEPLARMLSTFLASQSLEVHAATSGTEALRVLAAENIDLLLLDLRLPELNGIELLQRLRKSPRYADLPVVMMSGVFKEERHVQTARKLGVTHYLLKPFSRQAFLEAVQANLKKIKALPPAAALQEVAPSPASSLDHLVAICRENKTGVLKTGKIPPVTFIEGSPCAVHAAGGEAFSRFLLSRGVIEPDDARQLAERKEGRIFLTQTGLLTYDQLLEESRLFIIKCIVDGMDQPAAFREGYFPPEQPLVQLCLPLLLYEATKTHASRFDTGSFRKECSALYPARTQLFFRFANLVSLRKEDIDLLGAITGRKVLAEVVAANPDADEAFLFAYYLYRMGMLAFSPSPAEEAVPGFPVRQLLNRPIEESGAEEVSIGFDDLVDELSESVDLAVGEMGMAAPLSSDEIGFEQTVQRDYAFIKDKNYYEILGLTPSSFSFDALKDAYFTRTRLYSPERFMELSGATSSMAQEILALFANAYNTLSSIVAKERYDEILNANKVGVAGKQDDKLQARVQFQSGKVFLEMGEFENAEKAILDAYTLEPENAMHCAFLAWSIYKNPANRSSRTAIEKARSLLSRSLQLDKSADAYSFRGWMLLDEGRDGLAEGEFQKALKLNPNDQNARKGLMAIEEKREAQNKGFFKKFFS